MPHVGDRTFCSTTCRDKARRLQIGEKSPHYTSVPHVCGICGEGFMVQPGRLEHAARRGGGVFCSFKCGHEARRRKIAGKPRRGSKEPAGKLAAKKRDGYACVMCGFADMIHVHHIIPKSKQGGQGLENLITLCPNHHALAHLGTLKIETMKKAIARPADLLTFGSAQVVRPSGRIAKRFYRVDLA